MAEREPETEIPVYRLRSKIKRNLNENVLAATQDYCFQEDPIINSNKRKPTSSPDEDQLKSFTEPDSSTESGSDSDDSDAKLNLEEGTPSSRKVSSSSKKNVNQLKTLSCLSCGKEFRLPRYLARHTKRVHSKDGPQKCTKCSRQFKNAISFKAHYCTPVPCPVCNKEYTHPIGLKVHMDTMHNSKNPKPIPQKCTKCSLQFKDTKSFKRHLCTLDPKNLPSRMEFPTIVVQTGPLPKSKPKLFDCDHCEKSFTRRSILNSHREIHLGQLYRCPKCDKSFLRRHTLRSHIFRTHKMQHPKEYKCELCSMALPGKQAYDLHERRYHTGAMPFGCPICPKRFMDPAAVKYHVMFHTGEKPFKCSEPGCDKAYTRNSHLKQHMVTHTGNQPYKCRRCDKSFLQISHCRRHERNVHKFFEGTPTTDHVENAAAKESVTGTTAPNFLSTVKSENSVTLVPPPKKVTLSSR